MSEKEPRVIFREDVVIFNYGILSRPCGEDNAYGWRKVPYDSISNLPVEEASDDYRGRYPIYVPQVDEVIVFFLSSSPASIGPNDEVLSGPYLGRIQLPEEITRFLEEIKGKNQGRDHKFKLV